LQSVALRTKIVITVIEPMSAERFIVIRGARQHNLKNIDLVLPKEKLIVITGISGSGKSSLAFGTLYAQEWWWR
jgi:excinuclease ABC subunit A